jgi:hypothetical protein
MAAAKIGRVVRWGLLWCRAGDEYACGTCGARVVVDFAKESYRDESDIGEFLEIDKGAD